MSLKTMQISLDKLGDASAEQLESNKRNIAEEIEKYEKKMAWEGDLLADNKRKLELMEQLSAISDVENAPLNPQFPFQKNETWLKLHSEFLQLQSARDRKTMANELKNLEETQTRIAEEVARLKEAQAKIDEELSKRGA
jgi:hypothetical protein